MVETIDRTTATEIEMKVSTEPSLGPIIVIGPFSNSFMTKFDQQECIQPPADVSGKCSVLFPRRLRNLVVEDDEFFADLDLF